MPEPTDAEPTRATTTPRTARRTPRATRLTQGKGRQTTPAGKNTRRIAIIAGTAALTTAVSGIVGGVISPERVQSVLGLSESKTSEDSESKQVTDSTKTIAVDVPSSWGVIDDGFTSIDGVASPGLALRAGPDPSAFRIQSNETAYVGASAQALDDLGLTGLDDTAVERLLEARRESVAYLPQAGCTPTNDHTPELGDDWVGAVQAWRDCSSLDGWRAIEIEMVSSDRDVYVFIQIGLPATTPDEVSQRIVDSLDVLPGKLPVS